jgi:quinolinate synthase
MALGFEAVADRGALCGVACSPVCNYIRVVADIGCICAVFCMQTFDIVGPVCESADFLGKERVLPTPSKCFSSWCKKQLSTVEMLCQEVCCITHRALQRGLPAAGRINILDERHEVHACGDGLGVR